MIVSQLFPIFLTFFILIDPLGISMIFLSLSARYPEQQRRKIARKAPLIAFLVLSSFIYFGPALIQALGIEPGSLYIAGGILLFLIAIDLLFGSRRRTKTSDPKEDEETDITVFPLALPLMSGPGAITAVLLFVSEPGQSLVSSLTLQAIIGLVLFLASITMTISSTLSRILGKTGVMVIERIMGILLSGMSVQFVVNGLSRLGF